MVDISRNRKPRERKKILYPNIPSSIAPVSHNSDLPIPQRPLTQGSSSHALSATSSEEDHTDFETDFPCSSKAPHVLK